MTKPPADPDKPKSNRGGYRPGGGRPPEPPTSRQRQTALVLFAQGATQVQVARKLGRSKAWVVAHLEEEFREGYEFGNLEISGALYTLGVKDKNPAALIFLAKNRLGMSDRQDVNHMGNGGPGGRAEVAIRVEYVLPSSPNAFPLPPPERLLPAPKNGS